MTAEGNSDLPNEFQPFQGHELRPTSKEWTVPELTGIAGSQYENLVFWMVPARFHHLAMARHVQVEMVDEREKWYGQPAQVELNRSDHLTVLFDSQTYDDLAEKFAGIYEVSEKEIVELYMGTGIARHLFERRVKNLPPMHVEGIANLLSAPVMTTDRGYEGLSDAIRLADVDFTALEMQELVESIAYMDERQRTHINMLRFAVGLLFGRQQELKPEIPEDLLRPDSNLTTLCRDGIKNQLAKKHSYVKLFESLSLSTPDAQYRFSEGLSELELAAAFPMSSVELQPILDLCHPGAKDKNSAL